MIALDFNELTNIALLLFGAMIAFLLFVWAFKKLLEFIGIDNLAAYLQASKEIKREDYRKSVRLEKSKIREKQQLKEQKKLNKKQKNSKPKLSESERKANFYQAKDRADKKVFMSKKYQKYDEYGFFANKLQDKKSLAERVPSAYTRKHSSNSKRTERKHISKNYNDTSKNKSIDKILINQNHATHIPGWKTQELKTLHEQIKSHPDYKNSLVTDGGRQVIIVRTKSDNWLLHSEQKWSNLTDDQAKEHFDQRFMSPYYSEIRD